MKIMSQDSLREAEILDAQIWDDEPETAIMIANRTSRVTQETPPSFEMDGAVSAATLYGRRVYSPFLEGDQSVDTSSHSDMELFLESLNRIKVVIDELRAKLGEEVAEILAHDTRGVLYPLELVAKPLQASLKQAPTERAMKMLEKFRSGIDSLVFVRDAIRSLLHYQSERLIEQETASIASFFAERINGLQKESLKVELVMDTDSDVTIDTGTVGNLIQNMRNNAIKHGKATVMRIEVCETDDGMVEIVIMDNGSGMDNTDGITTRGVSHGGSSGLGLADAESRLATFGATLEIDGHGGLPNKNDSFGACFKIKLQTAYSQAEELEAQIA